MTSTGSMQVASLRILDEIISSTALMLMMVIALAEVAFRPLMGRGIDNAPALIQHLGLLMTMFGAVAAERHGHLTNLGTGLRNLGPPGMRWVARFVSEGSAAMICGVLAFASWQFVHSEIEAHALLAYGIPVWWVQASMPLGFLLLGVKLGARSIAARIASLIGAIVLPLTGWLFARALEGDALPMLPVAIWLVIILLTGAPIFAVLGALGLALFWKDAQPIAAIPLSHYQITVNASLPALPLFTLAGLIFARTGAAGRLGNLFVALFGGGMRGSVVAAAVLCSLFTAFTGGSGVTILALGGLLLPLLRNAGYPEQRGIGLVTSASALGVLLAPSVPLIMYAILARVPIQQMFLAGIIPALIMIGFLLLFGGYLRGGGAQPPSSMRMASESTPLGTVLWQAKWEILAPLVALGSLLSGIATPTETAAITAAFAIASQMLIHNELTLRNLAGCLKDCAQIIGGVMLILGMALGLTNYLVDAGIPDAAIEWVQTLIPNKFVFLLALNVVLFLAGSLMEIFAALVFLVPLLLPVAISYGVDPVHFGIIFLANMEMGFLCPPAGMNVYFASAMFGKPLKYVARAVLPAVLSIFLGTLAISWFPMLATALPRIFGGHP